MDAFDIRKIPSELEVALLHKEHLETLGTSRNIWIVTMRKFQSHQISRQPEFVVDKESSAAVFL